MLRVRFSFLLHTTLATSPEPHLQIVLSCRHPCHTWDLGPHMKWSVPTSRLSTLRLHKSTSSELGLRT